MRRGEDVKGTRAHTKWREDKRVFVQRGRRDSLNSVPARAARTHTHERTREKREQPREGRLAVLKQGEGRGGTEGGATDSDTERPSASVAVVLHCSRAVAHPLATDLPTHTHAHTSVPSSFFLLVRWWACTGVFVRFREGWRGVKEQQRGERRMRHVLMLYHAPYVAPPTLLGQGGRGCRGGRVFRHE